MFVTPLENIFLLLLVQFVISLHLKSSHITEVSDHISVMFYILMYGTSLQLCDDAGGPYNLTEP